MLLISILQSVSFKVFDAIVQHGVSAAQGIISNQGIKISVLAS